MDSTALMPGATIFFRFRLFYYMAILLNGYVLSGNIVDSMAGVYDSFC